MNRAHPSPKLIARVGIAAFVGLGAWLVSARAEAHTVGLSRGDYQLDGASIHAKLILARGELATSIAGLDSNRDGTIDQGELDQGKDPLTEHLVQRLSVSADGAACEGSLTKASLTSEDGVEVEATYVCKSEPKSLAFEAAFLDDLPRGHRHIAHVVAGTDVVDDVLHSHKKHLDVMVTRAGESVKNAPKPWHAVAWGFFLEGIEHILTGYDHLAFLFGLVLVRGKLKSVLAMVTAFTIAHSLTLALAVLGVFAPSPKFTEPAIALSVAYVGIENFIVKDVKNRWRITAPFGFIHGFGFAGALGQIQLPRPQIPLALLTFNLGVETGQLAVLALLLPLIILARRQPWFDRVGVKVLSGGIVVLGMIWFIGRIIWPPS